MTIRAPKKRGRPSKADIAARDKNKPVIRSDREILVDLKVRFDLLSRLTKGAIDREVRALIITGAPGVGKTFTVEQVLSKADVPHLFVRGAPPTAINLYMMAWNFRHAGNVIVLDDVDGILNDEETINMLKVLCDTGAERKISYYKEAQELKNEDIPKQFSFNGSMIFISNLDFQTFVDQGKNKYAVHFEALMNRSLYLDLRLHSRQEIGVWVNHIAESARLFDIENVPQHQRKPILDFLTEHRENLREFSIRTLKKLCSFAKMEPIRWKDDARVLLLRNK